MAYVVGYQITRPHPVGEPDVAKNIFPSSVLYELVLHTKNPISYLLCESLAQFVYIASLCPPLSPLVQTDQTPTNHLHIH